MPHRQRKSDRGGPRRSPMLKPTRFLRLISLTTLILAGCKATIPSSGEAEEGLPPNPHASTGSCGKERWSVKTGTDPDASKVNLSPTASTIGALSALTAPSSIPLNARVAPTELQAVRLSNVTLLQYKLENDSDYHLDISDGTNQMITEIPDPGCVGSGSPFASSISAARAAFDKQHPNAGGSFTQSGETVTLRRVPFFDFMHRHTRVAPNG